MDWIVLWAKPFEINEAVLLQCFEDLMEINLLPGTGRQQLAVILEVKQKIRVHNGVVL